MNSRTRLIYALGATALLLVAGCVPLESRRARIERTWPADSIKQIKVREVDGTISITGDSPDRITMVALVRARGVEPKPQEENQGYFRTEIDGDTLIIGERRERHDFFFWGREVRVDYELHVPAATALDLRSVNGRIATRAIEGETTATTVNGEVDIEVAGSEEVAARTVNGRVEAHFLKDFHGAKLGTVNGRVIAVLPPTASFYGDFTQVNGDFEAAFPLNIHSHPGSRRVSGEVNGGRYPLKITTVNGDIRIDNSAVSSR